MSEGYYSVWKSVVYFDIRALGAK